MKQDDNAIATADLFAGLMIVFLFIAVVFMQNSQAETESVRDLVEFNENQESVLLNALEEEFSNDLQRWGAVLDPNNLSIRFENPQILFSNGSAIVNQHFKDILDDFWPRYMRVVFENKQMIDTLSIEGHTSSRWNTNTDAVESYFLNMELSQDRTRNVLRYCESISSENQAGFIRRHITANGLSSSRIIYSRGFEDASKSRRVEFVINKKNNDEELRELITTLGRG